MNSDTMSNTSTLKQFEGIFYEEFYDSGEKETQFEIRTAQSPLVFVLSNEGDDQDYNLLYREDRGQSVNLVVIDRWDNGVKFNKIVVERRWLGVALINLSPEPYEINFKFSSK